MAYRPGTQRGRTGRAGLPPAVTETLFLAPLLLFLLAAAGRSAIPMLMSTGNVGVIVTSDSGLVRATEFGQADERSLQSRGWC